jgi:hypothetical protein
MISKFSEFNENRSENYILYYSFDWDDNILNMSTVIHMEEYLNGAWVPKDVSTGEFAEVRAKKNFRIIDNDPDKAFSEFRDNGPRGLSAFLEDTKLSVSKGNFGPSWGDFIECLTNGSIFSIITARGHERSGLLPGIEWIIDEYLSDNERNIMYSNLLKFEEMFGKDVNELPKELSGKSTDNPVFKRYLSYCDMVGVSSPSRGGDTSNPEAEKEKALLEFKEKVNKYAIKIGLPAKIGFSDDDMGNIKRIEDLVKNLKHERFSHIKEYVVKGTTDPNNITKMVRTIESGANMGVGGSAGLQSSLIGFKDFGTLSDKVFTDNNDTGNAIIKKSSKALAKMSQEILEDEDEKEDNKDKKVKRVKNSVCNGVIDEHIKKYEDFHESKFQDIKDIIESGIDNVITRADIEEAKSMVES